MSRLLGWGQLGLGHIDPGPFFTCLVPIYPQRASRMRADGAQHLRCPPYCLQEWHCVVLFFFLLIFLLTVQISSDWEEGGGGLSSCVRLSPPCFVFSPPKSWADGTACCGGLTTFPAPWQSTPGQSRTVVQVDRERLCLICAYSNVVSHSVQVLPHRVRPRRRMFNVRWLGCWAPVEGQIAVCWVRVICTAL